MRHPVRVDWPLEILNALPFAGRSGGTRLTLRSAPLAAMQSECETFEAARDVLRARLERRLDRLAAHLAAPRCGRRALEERRPWISDACSRLPSTACPETSPCS